MKRTQGSVKYGAAFGVMALGSVVFGASAGTVGRVCSVWMGLALGWMAVAYLGVGPRGLGKRADGGRHAWAQGLLAPYLILNGLLYAVYRGVDRRPAFDRITEVLWLGRKLSPAEALQPRRPNWVAVLDLAPEFSETRALRDLVAYRSVPILDGTAPDPTVLAETIPWLIQQTAQGPVFVHCALGHGRSATVVAAFLVATGQVSGVEEAKNLLREARPGVGWNSDQEQALREFAQSCGQADFRSRLGLPLPPCEPSGNDGPPRSG